MNLASLPQSCDKMVTVAAIQDVIQGSEAARVLNCHAYDHANAGVLWRAATKIMPVLSKNQKQ